MPTPSSSDQPDPAIERLIEKGLEHYGAGDLDGALLCWESALSMVPDEPRALGYVEYVKANYPLLTGGSADDSELAVPFGLANLDDDAAYEVEIGAPAAVALDGRAAPLPGPWPQVPLAGASSAGTALDDGWFLDEDTSQPPVSRPLPLPAFPEADFAGAPRAAAAEPGVSLVDDTAPMELELEADEPDDLDLEEPIEDSFTQERTRNLGVRRVVTADFAPPEPPAATGEFDPAELTGEPTAEIRGARSFGFVRPTGALHPTHDSTPLRNAADATAADAVAADAMAALSRSVPGMAWASADQHTVEMRVRVRDLAEQADQVDPLSSELPAAPALGSRASVLRAGEPRPKRDSRAVATGGPGEDDVETLERNQWAQAGADTTSEHELTRERNPLVPRSEAMGASSSMTFDLDDDGDLRSDVDAPLVIVDDPELADAATFDARTEARRSAGGEARRDVDDRGDDGSDAADNDEFDAAATVDRGHALRNLGLSLVGRADAVPVEVVAHDLLERIDRGAPTSETPDERTRRRIQGLLERSAEAARAGHHSSAVIAVDLALAEDPDSAAAQKLIHRNREAVLAVYQQFLGDLTARPAVAVPMHDLAAQALDSRSAFLLSRIDGNLTFEEILDVAGMTRMEAFRYLARLLLRGILEVR